MQHTDKAIAALAVLMLLTGCSPAEYEKNVRAKDGEGPLAPVNVWRDEERGVTCYSIYSRAIDCVPDSQLRAAQ